MKHQMKSVENESWIDIPANLYNSEVPIKAKRIVLEKSDLIDAQQAAIANYYNTDRKEYWLGRIEGIQSLVDLLPSSTSGNRGR